MKKFILFVVCCIMSCMQAKALENDSHVEIQFLDSVYSNRDVGGQFYTGPQGMVYVNGKVAYCLDPTILLRNDTYSSSNDFSLTNISEEQLNYLEVVSYFGYGYPGRVDTNYYLATQEIIWEYLTQGEVYWTMGKGGDQINIDNYKNEILTSVNRYRMTPNLPTYVDTYQGDDILLEDTNGVLEYYESDLWLGEIKGNTLKLSAEFKGTATVTLTKKHLNYETSYVYMSNNSQSLATFGFSGKQIDSFRVTYKVKTLTQIHFMKRDSVSGNLIKNRETKIKVYDVIRGKYIEDNGSDILTIGESGELTTETYLEEGEYRIEEVTSPVGYKTLAQPITFNIYEYHGPMMDITIYNEPMKYTVTIYKKGEVYLGIEENNGIGIGIYSLEDMNGVTYGLYAKEDIIDGSGNILYQKNTLVTQIDIQNGFGTTYNLDYGKYYIKELKCPNSYILDTAVTEVDLTTEKNILTFNFINYLKKGNLVIPYKLCAH